VGLGDNIVLNYNNRRYEIEIRETRPGNAISVIETDCNVDFDPPKDYVPPSKVPKVVKKDEEAIETEKEEPELEDDSFLAFSGRAQRLDGKAISTSGDPVRVPLYSGLTRYPPPEEKEEPKKTQKNGKNGKLMSSGNRLLDKLQRDGKLPGGPPNSQAAPPGPNPEKKEEPDDDESNFKPFSGKGFTLK